MRGRTGLAIVCLVVVAAALGPWLIPYDPVRQDLPMRLAGPSWQHWLGLDELGRDLLARLVVGARVSLFVGIAVVSVSAVGCETIAATRRPRNVFRRGPGSASLQPAPSIAPGPAMIESASSRSTALRASGPMTEMSDGCAEPGSAWPPIEQISQVGLCP